MITIGILRAKGLDALSSLTNARVLINNNLAIVGFSYSQGCPDYLTPGGLTLKISKIRGGVRSLGGPVG